MGVMLGRSPWPQANRGRFAPLVELVVLEEGPSRSLEGGSSGEETPARTGARKGNTMLMPLLLTGMRGANRRVEPERLLTLTEMGCSSSLPLHRSSPDPPSTSSPPAAPLKGAARRRDNAPTSLLLPVMTPSEAEGGASSDDARLVAGGRVRIVCVEEDMGVAAAVAAGENSGALECAKNGAERIGKPSATLGAEGVV